LNLIFIFNPKCGCTTLKHFIDRVDNIRTDSNENIYNSVRSNTNISEIMTKYKDCYVVYFVRNPYERFISGYSKIINKLILRLKIDKTLSIKKCNEMVNYGDITIDEWATVIANIDHNNIEDHFSPQTRNIGNLLNHKNVKLYDIKNLDNICEYINKNFGINLVTIVNPRSNYIKPIISSETKEIIYKYYKNDFDLLCYDKDFEQINNV